LGAAAFLGGDATFTGVTGLSAAGFSGTTVAVLVTVSVVSVLVSEAEFVTAVVFIVLSPIKSFHVSSVPD